MDLELSHTPAQVHGRIDPFHTVGTREQRDDLEQAVPF